MIITTIITFLAILGVIVFFHELGHFITAKFYGVKVDEFGIGFPPKIYSFKKGETEYSVNLIPLGGFVKIKGEDGEDRDDPRSFSSKSVGKRFQILSAGVLMNFFLAFAVFSAIFMLGFPQDITGKNLSEIENAKNVKIQISQIAEDSPAEQAGLMAGDAVLKIDGNEIKDIKYLQDYTAKKKGEAVVLNILRGKDSFDKEVIPRKDYPKDEGPIGISIVKTADVSHSPLEAVKLGFSHTVNMATLVITTFAGVIWSLLNTGKTSVELSGPVGIAVMTQQAISLGFTTILYFTALISVNLAIINAVPFPALDGGRLLFLAVEKIRGYPINQETEGKINNFGFMLLMLLMIIVTFRDVAKFDLWEKLTNFL